MEKEVIAMGYRFSTITSVMLTVTHSCNLRCKYCFVHKEPQTMTLQTAKDTADFLIRNCEHGEVPSINFFGGEPMICWDSIIVPLTKYIRDELHTPFSLSMTTNGTLLNRERIAFMKQYEIGVLFSIDGGKETQDFNRPYINGSGSFESLRDLIPIIAQEFHPTFRMTAIPPSCGNLSNDILFAEQSGFDSFFVIPNVFEQWSDSAWDTLKNEMHQYALHFINCYRDGTNPIRFSEFEKALKNITRINHAITNNMYRDKCDSCNKCGLGMSRFASIHPNGDIYACQELTSNDGPDSIFWIGNIYSGVSDERRAALSRLFEKSKVRGADCSRCRLSRICDGGCVANNFLANGDVNHLPVVYCKWHQLLLDEAIFTMNELAENERFISEWRNQYGNTG